MRAKFASLLCWYLKLERQCRVGQSWNLVAQTLEIVDVDGSSRYDFVLLSWLALASAIVGKW